MTLLAFRSSLFTSQHYSSNTGTPKLFGSAFEWSQSHAICPQTLGTLTVPGPKRSYIPGLTRRVGLLGRTSWGAWRLQAVVAAAKVPGPACA